LNERAILALTEGLQGLGDLKPPTKRGIDSLSLKPDWKKIIR